MGAPEAIVLRAMGRTYNDPGALDDATLELVKQFKSLPGDAQKRLIRMIAIYSGMSEGQRAVAESVVRGIIHAEDQ
jgi:hypothetical protein